MMFQKADNRLKKLAVFLLIIGTAATDAIAGEQRTFVVGVQDFAEYRPYSYIKAGEYSGLNRDLLDLFAARRGYVFVYRTLPIKRLYKSFISHRVDFKYPDNPYWSVAVKGGKSIIYSQPVVRYTDGLMVRPERKGGGMDNIRTLGMIAGFTPYPFLSEINSGKVEVTELFNYEQALKITILQKVDGLYSNIAVSRYYLKHVLKDGNALVYDESLPHIDSTRHLSTIRYPQVIKEFDLFLEKNKNEIDGLKAKHGLSDGR